MTGRLRWPVRSVPVGCEHLSYTSLPRPSRVAKQAARVRRHPHLFRWLALISSLWLSTCRAKQDETSTAPSALESAKRGAEQPPLSAVSDLLEIADVGAVKASVPLSLAVPIGARQPKPVILVQQAVDSDPSHLCREIQSLTQRNAFVLCQALAVDGPSGSELREPGEAEQQLQQGLGEVKRSFSSYVARGPAVLVAVGDLSRHVAFMVRKEPSFFARVLQVSADLEGWTAGAATLFAQRGGERLLFGCAKPEMLDAAAHRATLVKRRGAEARAVLYEGAMQRSDFLRFLREHWSWLVQGDQRFTSLGRGKD